MSKKEKVINEKIKASEMNPAELWASIPDRAEELPQQEQRMRELAAQIITVEEAEKKKTS